MVLSTMIYFAFEAFLKLKVGICSFSMGLFMLLFRLRGVALELGLMDFS
jgi:hypothetical protein